MFDVGFRQKSVVIELVCTSIIVQEPWKYAKNFVHSRFWIIIQLQFILYFERCQKKNKRNLNRSKIKRRLWYVLIDDFDVLLRWRERSQNLQKEEKWKWSHRDRLCFDETRSLKAFIDLMIVIFSEAWFVETITSSLNHIQSPNSSTIEWIDLMLQAWSYDLKKHTILCCFLQNTKRFRIRFEKQASRRSCFNRSEVLFKIR